MNDIGWHDIYLALGGRFLSLAATITLICLAALLEYARCHDTGKTADEHPEWLCELDPPVSR